MLSVLFFCSRLLDPNKLDKEIKKQVDEVKPHNADSTPGDFKEFPYCDEAEFYDIVLGYDRRFLSESAARWVAEILVQGGLKVWFLHRSAPTPLIMHTVKDRQLHYGIEVTASHNPANYNGIKLIVDEERDAPLEMTNRLEELISDLDEIS